ATVLTRGTKITLQTINWNSGSASLNGSGEFNLDDRRWHLALDGGKVPVQELTIGPLAFRLRASGKETTGTLDELRLTSGDIEIHGDGYYDTNKPRPVGINLVLSHFPTLEGADANAFVRGKVYGEVSL